MNLQIVEPRIEYKQIVSSNHFKNLNNISAMRIGVSDKKNIYRVLFKIPMNKIPPNASIVSAFLKINLTPIRSRYQNIITPYALAEDWKLNTVTWDNQPPFNLEIFGESVKVTKTSHYSVDITPIVEKWYNNEISDYGIVLKNYELKSGALVKMNTYINKPSEPKVEIFYEHKCQCEIIPTKFIERIEEFDTYSSYRYSIARNTSLTKTVIFFVENQGDSKTICHLQVSPDGVNYINEPAEISLEKNEIKFLVPCIFGKFTRVAARDIHDSEKSRIKIWYLSQE